MKIIQIFSDTKNTHIYRYISELDYAINNNTEHELYTYLLNEDTEKYYKLNINQNTIDFINTCDYLFIHSLPTKKNEIFTQLLYNVKINIIFFVHYNTVKEFYNNFNINYIKPIFNKCYKILIYDNDKIYNEINNIINNTPNKIIRQPLIYNLHSSYYEEKENQIAMISNRGLKTDYKLYIDIFKKYHIDFSNYIWYLYGITKNIQTISVEDLYYDKNGNPSSITNLNTKIIDKDKINIYSQMSYNEYSDLLNKIMFVVNFDKLDYITYSMLDILAGKAILIIDSNIAKKIKINSKQTLYDLNCAIYFDVNNENDFSIIMNKYLKSKNSYISLCRKNQKIIDQVFNSNKYLQDLFNKII